MAVSGGCESRRTIARHFGRDVAHVGAARAELNGRPRETLGWRSPTERFLELAEAG